MPYYDPSPKTSLGKMIKQLAEKAGLEDVGYSLPPGGYQLGTTQPNIPRLPRWIKMRIKQDRLINRMRRGEFDMVKKLGVPLKSVKDTK